jgi:hypothetical protein
MALIRYLGLAMIVFSTTAQAFDRFPSHPPIYLRSHQGRAAEYAARSCVVIENWSRAPFDFYERFSTTSEGKTCGFSPANARDYRPRT